MLPVNLQREIYRIADEMRLSEESVDARFEKMRAELDRIKLEMEVLRRSLAKVATLPVYARELNQIKEKTVQ